MDGVVVEVAVACGDLVERHAVLVVLEAMKMQIPVTDLKRRRQVNRKHCLKRAMLAWPLEH